MTTPDRPLFTAQLVDASKPGLLALDLAEHKIVEKNRKQWLRIIGRNRFISRLGSVVGVPSVIGGFGLFSWGLFSLVTSGHVEQSVPVLTTILVGAGSSLNYRSNRLWQKTNTIEQALIGNIER